MSLQNNIKSFNSTDILNYALFTGGANAKHNALKQYDPFKSGYARIFLTLMPRFMEKAFNTQTKNFRHIVEYGFIGVDGIGNLGLEFEQMTGGYAGRAIDVATLSKDETTEITIKVYEFSGSPVREFLELWITGISDPYTGFAHYHGAMAGPTGIKHSQHNHTMEAFYVVTDPTGHYDAVEYCCFLANMMPKSVKKDHLNHEAGQVSIAQFDMTFTCVRYESAQINLVGKKLIQKYNILRDYLNFHSDYEVGADGITTPLGTQLDIKQLDDFVLKTP